MQRGELASPTRSIVDEMLWAQFHFGLSVRSVKVVRHKMAEYFVRGCGKAAGSSSARFSISRNCPTQAKGRLEWATRLNLTWLSVFGGRGWPGTLRQLETSDSGCL